MRTGIIFFFCAVLFMVAGCAQVPIPASFPYSDELLQSEPSYFRQQQLQSVTHWQLIAKLTTERISSDRDVAPLLKPDSQGNRQSIHVEDTDKSEFGKALQSCLITELRNQQFVLSDGVDEPINLRWTTQIVNRNAVRPKTFLGVPAFIVQVAGFILTGDGWGTTDVAVPKTEVLLTTYVTTGKDSPAHIVKSWSDIFYINEGDTANYLVQVASAVHPVHPRSIAAKDEAWRIRLAKQGLLSQ